LSSKFVKDFLRMQTRRSKGEIFLAVRGGNRGEKSGFSSCWRGKGISGITTKNEGRGRKEKKSSQTPGQQTARKRESPSLIIAQCFAGTGILKAVKTNDGRVVLTNSRKDKSDCYIQGHLFRQGPRAKGETYQPTFVPGCL